MAKRKRLNLPRLGAYVVLVVFFTWVALPIVWATTLSLKTGADIIRIPTGFIFSPTLENYIRVLHSGEFMHQFGNSLVIGFMSTLLSLLIGVPAAYTLQRFRFAGRERIDFWILSTRMAPPVIVLIPYFLVFQKLGLTDSRLAIIIMHLSVNLVLVVWLMKGYFSDVPEELTEAALVDGSHRLERILPHQSPPGHGRHGSDGGFLAFMFSWNELMFALILSGVNPKPPRSASELHRL